MGFIHLFWKCPCFFHVEKKSDCLRKIKHNKYGPDLPAAARLQPGLRKWNEVLSPSPILDAYQGLILADPAFSEGGGLISQFKFWWAPCSSDVEPDLGDI